MKDFLRFCQIITNAVNIIIKWYISLVFITNTMYNVLKQKCSTYTVYYSQNNDVKGKIRHLSCGWMTDQCWWETFKWSNKLISECYIGRESWLPLLAEQCRQCLHVPWCIALHHTTVVQLKHSELSWACTYAGNKEEHGGFVVTTNETDSHEFAKMDRWHSSHTPYDLSRISFLMVTAISNPCAAALSNQYMNVSASRSTPSPSE